jgi:hypothetical protein
MHQEVYPTDDNVSLYLNFPLQKPKWYFMVRNGSSLLPVLFFFQYPTSTRGQNKDKKMEKTFENKKNKFSWVPTHFFRWSDPLDWNHLQLQGRQAVRGKKSGGERGCRVACPDGRN